MNNYTLEDFTVANQITNDDLLSYAISHINLPPDIAKKYREHVKSVRERLEKYITLHPDYGLVKMLHSGSLPKGSALRDISDLDTAVYVKEAAVQNKNNNDLIAWLRDRLQEVYPTFEDFQLEPHEHCVTITYKTPSLKKIDVVPVLYKGDPDNMGYLVTKDGRHVLTSISRHIEFIQRRKARQPEHYAQFVRFAKYWTKLRKNIYKARGEHFRFKSLMVELICAHLADQGLDTSDYTESLQQFFAYIVRTELKEPIFFDDFYNPNQIKLSDQDVIHIYDPVNPENNIGRTYDENQRRQIVEEAHHALDAITTAATATTKSEAILNWQKILGTTFGG
jgi:hypothetical protein